MPTSTKPPPRLGRGLLLEKEESFYPVYFFGGQKETPPRGGKGLPPYQPCLAAKDFYVGRHSHADINPTTSPAWGGDSSLKRRRVLFCLFFWGPKRNAPARRQGVAALPALFGGKGLPSKRYPVDYTR